MTPVGHRSRLLAATVAVVAAVVGGGISGAPVAGAAAATTVAVSYGVGARSLSQPSPGGRFVYVSTNGSDTYKQYGRAACLRDPADAGQYQDRCPEPTASSPLRTVQAGIRAARPGDVIVVREGVYAEAIGWGIQRGTVERPIVLQASPGERVEVNGTLIMASADHWTINGIRFTYNSGIQTGQSVVLMSGGDGWSFTNNEVQGTRGVANVLVNATTTSGSTAQLTAAAPRNYLIGGNCIHDNRAVDAAGTDHNIYLMSSIWSTGGLIERNLIAGAPRGANIKAAGSTPATASGSPRNVTIRYNTLLSAASGLTIGLAAEGVEAQRNIIAVPNGSGRYDGAVKTYQLDQPGKNAVKDSVLSGYARPISEDFGVTRHIFTARNDTASPVTYTGSIANCSAVAASATLRSSYGHLAR